MGTTFASVVTDGPLLVAAAGRRAGRADQLRLALRAAAGARLPVLRRRAGRHRRPRRRAGAVAPGGGARRTAVRTDDAARRAAGWSLGALLFVLGFTVVFVAVGAAFGGLGRLLLRARRRPHPGARRGHDRRRAGVPRLAAAAPAHRADHRPPGRRAGRGAAARHRLRAGLDAVPRARRCRRSTRWPSSRRPPRAARCSASPTASASACRSCWSRWAPAGRWARRRSCAATPAR